MMQPGGAGMQPKGSGKGLMIALIVGGGLFFIIAIVLLLVFVVF